MKEPLHYLDPLSLEAFIAVCESGNFTTAARRLDLTQSAVSQRILTLERDVRTDLLDRKLRPIVPTPAGEMLYRKALSLLSDTRNIMADIRECSAVRGPGLRLGITEFFSRIFIPAVVGTLSQWIGNLTVAVASSFEIGRAFLDREIHIAVTTDPLLRESELQRYELCTEPLIIAVHKELLSGDNSRGDTLNWLVEHRDFIGYSACSPLAAQIQTALRREGFKVEPRLLFNSSGGIIDMVSKRLGWAVTTPLSILPAHSGLGDVHLALLGAKAFRRSLFLVARTREFERLQMNLSGLACDVLRDVALPLLKEQAPWLSNSLEVAPFSFTQMDKVAVSPSRLPNIAGRKRVL